MKYITQKKNQNIRYTIKDYKRDVSLCMRVFKEIIKKKTMKKMQNNEKESKDLL